MRIPWKRHFVLSDHLSHAHYKGYSILWARTKNGRFYLGGATYEVSPAPSGGEIERFNTRKEMLKAIS